MSEKVEFTVMDIITRAHDLMIEAAYRAESGGGGWRENEMKTAQMLLALLREQLEAEKK